MRYSIEDQTTGLVDGYYISKMMAEGVAEGLNLMTRDHLFLVKKSSERNHVPINDVEFLGRQDWFISMVSESLRAE